MNTKIQKNQRLQKIIQQLKAGMTRSQIHKDIKEEFQVSDQTVDKDFMTVNQLLRNEIQTDCESLKLILNARLESLYDKAIDDNKLALAIKIIDQQSKLNSLYVDKQEVNFDKEFKIEIN